MTLPLRQYRDHRRTWRDNYYVYPVISRRSKGLSIGINLNPDTACNFDCVYCQVDRTGAPRVREVHLDVLRAELRSMLEVASSGQLSTDPQFSDAPPDALILRDIAFSGDGEPTTCPEFSGAVEVVADLHTELGLGACETVLITDACYLEKPNIQAGVAAMDACNGVIWAKLDAGTEEYYRRVNRPNYPLTHVLSNIKANAKRRPIVIQSLFLRMSGLGPTVGEIAAYVGRLHEIVSEGGIVRDVQVYTIARATAESFVTSLSHAELDAIVAAIQAETNLEVFPFYAPV